MKYDDEKKDNRTPSRVAGMSARRNAGKTNPLPRQGVEKISVI
jgi:hypothetical protein